MADHVVVGTGGHGTKILNKDYPFTEGLTAGTTKQTGESRLHPVASYTTEKVYGS